MSASAWENLDDFLSPDEFADLATFTRHDDVIAKDVPGIFDDPQMNVEAGEYDMNVSDPRFTCAFARVAMLKKNDAAVIGGVAYLLDHDPKSDGTGLAVLKLSRDFDV